MVYTALWDWLERTRPGTRLLVSLLAVALALLFVCAVALIGDWWLQGRPLVSANTQRVLWLAVVAAAIGLMVVWGVMHLLARGVDRPRQHLNRVIESIAQGKHDQPVPYRDYNNGAGQMARALETLRVSVHAAADDHWVKSSANKLFDVMRAANSTDELADEILSSLATLLALGHGAFYRVDEQGHLVLAATYAMTKRKQLQTSFLPGEGLPGQCLVERKAICLTLPSDHVFISSGLGSAPALQVMACPLVVGESVLAVMELGCYGGFSPRQRRLLQELAAPLASSLRVLERNQQTRELLVLAQTQSEQMQKQAAQLEEHAVELEARQAELSQTDAWYRIIINNAWDGILIVDGRGMIEMANPAAERMFGYEAGSLLGMSVDQLVPDSVREGHAAMRQAFVQSGRSRGMEASPALRGCRRDGSEFSMQALLTPLPLRDTRGRCVSVAIREV